MKTQAYWLHSEHVRHSLRAWLSYGEDKIWSFVRLMWVCADKFNVVYVLVCCSLHRTCALENAALPQNYHAWICASLKILLVLLSVWAHYIIFTSRLPHSDDENIVTQSLNAHTRFKATCAFRLYSHQCLSQDSWDILFNSVLQETVHFHIARHCACSLTITNIWELRLDLFYVFVHRWRT